MSEQLQQAYNALMVKAPGAAFQKARALYLNKYPLPQADGSAPLRLYVCDERLEESIQPANDGDPNHRLAILRSRPGQLAVVHWQQPHPPEPEQLRRRDAPGEGRGVTRGPLVARRELDHRAGQRCRRLPLPPRPPPGRGRGSWGKV